LITLEKMLKEKKWAVIGAKEEKDTIGWKIPDILKRNGYTVYKVNPKYSTLDGEKSYSSIKEIEEDIDCVDIIVNPKIAVTLLKDIRDKGVKYVCFQPGTFDKTVKERAEELGLNYVRGCVYAALSKKEM
jgi:uncharacterized protein